MFLEYCDGDGHEYAKRYEDELLLIHEGLMQSWPLLGKKSLIVANKLVSEHLKGRGR